MLDALTLMLQAMLVMVFALSLILSILTFVLGLMRVYDEFGLRHTLTSAFALAISVLGIASFIFT